MTALTRGGSFVSSLDVLWVTVVVLMPQLPSRGRRYLSFRTSLASRAPRA